MTQEKYEQLKKDFPQEAYSVDKSRGFQLIGLKSAFVIERLNEVFGLVGSGWRYSHSTFSTHTKEVVVEVAIQYYVGEDLGGHAHEWDAERATWYADIGSPRVWSSPVYATGGNMIGKGGVPASDARKSALTNALSKASSRLGVGINAYKGMLTVAGKTVSVKETEASQVEDEDAAIALDIALNALFVNDPAKYDALVSKNLAGKAHKTNLIQKLYAEIKHADLVELIGDNLGQIVGNKKKSKLAQLGAADILFVSGFATAISEEKIAWKDALAACEAWDKSMTFEGLIGSLANDKATKAK